MNIEIELPVLYKRGSTGKIQQWQITVQHEEGSYTLVIYRGQVDGKIITERSKTITKGKNIGKLNEKLPKDQAISEAQSKHDKKKDEGYTENIEESRTNVIVLPMLAQKFQDMEKKYITYDCFVQTKLDGCVSGDSVVETDTGFFKISDIVEKNIGKKIRSYNIKTKKKEFKEILNRTKNGIDAKEKNIEYYQIELENGYKLEITGNHRVWIDKLNCYRRVDELNGDEELLID